MSHSVVIGGAGFVGSWVVDEILKDSGAKVTIIDNLISSEKWNISNDPRVTFIEGSAADVSTFDKITEHVDFVYQLACFHGNQSSIARPLEDFENSLKTTLATLEWVKLRNPNARVVYSGAGCTVALKTWRKPKSTSELEEITLTHDSPYSISKITGEMYCAFYIQNYNLDIVRVRFQNIYGPREILGAGIWRGTQNTIWRNVIPTFIWKALNNETIQVFGQKASRDFVYVTDAARGIIQASLHGTSGGIYNIASGEEIGIQKLAKLIIELTDSKSSISLNPRRNWDNSGRRVADISKAQRELGFQNSIELKKGLENTILWTTTNRRKIQSCIDRHLPL